MIQWSSVHGTVVILIVTIIVTMSIESCGECQWRRQCLVDGMLWGPGEGSFRRQACQTQAGLRQPGLASTLPEFTGQDHLPHVLFEKIKRKSSGVPPPACVLTLLPVPERLAAALGLPAGPFAPASR